jgi:hypothetical protein
VLSAGTVQRSDVSCSALMQALLQRLPTCINMSVIMAESSMGSYVLRPARLLPLASRIRTRNWGAVALQLTRGEIDCRTLLLT